MEKSVHKSYLPSLDGFRTIAVTLVFLFHFCRLDFISMKFEIGWIGVQMFFVLSGFLITRILIDQKTNPLAPFLKRFYLRRVLRIFPLYFGYLLLLSIVYITFRQPDDFSRYSFSLFTYTYNFSILFRDWGIDRMFAHLWSLSVEEQFYILWPFVVYFLTERQLKIVVIGLLLGCPVLRWVSGIILSGYWSDPELIGNAVYWMTFNHLDAFALGGGLNLFAKNISKSDSTKLITVSGGICLVAGLFNAYLLHNLVSSDLGYPIHSIANLQHVWSYSILNLFFAAVILRLVYFPVKILSGGIMVWLGKISYGIYLFHFPVLVAFDKLVGRSLGNELMSLLLTYAVTVILAWVSYVLYESPFLRLKVRIG